MVLEEVKQKIYSLCEKINLDTNSHLLPLFSENSSVFSDGASIYVDNLKCHYIIMERGKINKQYESEKLDDIMYILFESITFSLASDYELEHRNEHEDSRKQLWEKQLELLAKIDIKFVDRCKREIDSILKIAPYRD
ncbi:Imm63 family immunity protein [Pygmaiobacter massiliensis]|uniref:Imm63 family immunity protein n=1 Tax=Pygmaiobacter massiliensis TaxID=1917873 RepID=UPI00289DA97C|nr:Imm63 family immunity protein [Pygmaiobacter massiliensis]